MPTGDLQGIFTGDKRVAMEMKRRDVRLAETFVLNVYLDMTVSSFLNVFDLLCDSCLIQEYG